MLGCQFSPNGNRVISSHYDSSGFGELAEWTLPSPYFCTYEPNPNDYLKAGQPVLTRNINTPGHRIGNFWVAPNGIDILSPVGDTANNLLGGWRMTDPWNILSIVYDGDTGTVVPKAGAGTTLFVPDDGTCIYRRSGALIRQYILDGDPWKPVLNDGIINQTKDLTSEFSTAMKTLYINRNWMHVTPGTTTPNYMYQYKRV
jgi:hypothetical protein